MNYGNKIIDCLKENIKFGIYIFNSKYYKDNSIMKIIKDFNKECNLDLKNSLFILNKIDQVSDEKKVYNEFTKYLLEQIGDNIYNDYNSIVALDSICLKYENLSEYNINYYISYIFKKTIQEQKPDLSNITEEFLNKIKGILKEIFDLNNHNNNDFDKFCKSMANKISADEKEKLTNIIKNLSSQEIQSNIDFNFEPKDNDDFDYIKAIYECFKEKLFIMSQSDEKTKLINYF